MLVSHLELADRVARRYLSSRSDTDPDNQDIFWTLPAHEVDVPDELVVQSSNGCTITTADVEASIAKTMGIVPGSCRFYQVNTRDETNGTRFEILVNEGKKLQRGLVTVNIVADAHKLTAFSLIELDVDSSI